MDDENSKKNSKSEITNALDKVEATSAVLNEKKRILAARIKKHVKPVKEVSIQEKTDLDGEELKRKDLADFKFKAQFGTCLFLLTAIIFHSLTREERMTWMENGMIIMCCLGMAAAKKNRG